MTINYIKHEQEFYGVIKLRSGETILGSMIASEDDRMPGLTQFFVSDPATPQTHQVEKEGQAGLAVGLIKWMMFSDEDFYMISEEDICTVAPMSMESVLMYKLWVRKEKGGNKTDIEIPVNPGMGYVGKVSDARKKLEDFWKRTQA
tara:strand:- start:2311 stop:2748 length:438 start_codon:yes stop_codon:yes gene_type:complete